VRSDQTVKKRSEERFKQSRRGVRSVRRPRSETKSDQTVKKRGGE